MIRSLELPSKQWLGLVWRNHRGPSREALIFCFRSGIYNDTSLFIVISGEGRLNDEQRVEKTLFPTFSSRFCLTSLRTANINDLCSGRNMTGCGTVCRLQWALSRMRKSNVHAYRSYMFWYPYIYYWYVISMGILVRFVLWTSYSNIFGSAIGWFISLGWLRKPPTSYWSW